MDDARARECILPPPPPGYIERDSTPDSRDTEDTVDERTTLKDWPTPSTPPARDR